MVRVVFVSYNTFGSWFIELFTWSKYSHVGIIDHEDYIIESRFKYGVRRVSLQEALKNAKYYTILNVEASDDVIIYAKTQIGKKYDWLAIVGFGFRINWQRENKWFCSELVAWAFNKAGTPLIREKKFRITPQNLYLSPLLKK